MKSLKKNKVLIFVILLVLGSIVLLGSTPSAKADSGSGLVVAKARLMTPEEMALLKQGYGTEEHCAGTGNTCSEANGWDGECCRLSSENICENNHSEEFCDCSPCGGFFDPCDKTCVADPKADCGKMGIYSCQAKKCLIIYPYGGVPIFVAYDGNCSDVFQCHTVDS